MQKSEKIEKIKNIVNDLIKVYLHSPWRIHAKISKHNVDIVYCSENAVVRLTAKTWQDNYYHELVLRARLDIYVYYMSDKKGDHLYISSQYDWDEEPDDIYSIIKKVVTIFNDIYSYHQKRQQLARESPDISPGSPRARLDEEFYNRDWTI